MFRWLGHALTLAYGLGALALGLFNVWLWARGGFRFPRYVHVMALLALVLGWVLEQASAEAGVPPPKGGALSAVLLLLVFPALVYGAFVFFGGGTSDDRRGNDGFE